MPAVAAPARRRGDGNRWRPSHPSRRARRARRGASGSRSPHSSARHGRRGAGRARAPQAPSARAPSGCAAAAPRERSRRRRRRRRTTGRQGGRRLGESGLAADARREQAEEHRVAGDELVVARIAVARRRGRATPPTPRSGCSASPRSIPASTSWPWSAVSVWCERRRRRIRSADSSVRSAGTERRSPSTAAMTSAASDGRATRSRPTRHAAVSRRPGGRGSSRDHNGAATRRDAEEIEVGGDPTTDGQHDGGVAQLAGRHGAVIDRAWRMASPNGGSQRSSSSGRRGRPNVSATGPGPSTGPVARASSPTAVIGRLCRRTSRPSGVDRPLDVLRSAEQLAGAARQPGEPVPGPPGAQRHGHVGRRAAQGGRASTASPARRRPRR